MDKDIKLDFHSHNNQQLLFLLSMRFIKKFYYDDRKIIMDSIDTYMRYFLTNYKWEYSTPYLLSGIYCTHINNIDYLTEIYKTNYTDMRNIIECATG